MENLWYVRLLSALYMATFLIRLSFAIMIVAFPVYLMHVGYATLGFLWAASPAFELLTVLAIGAAMDKYGRKVVLMFGLGTGALSLYLVGITTYVPVIFIVNAFHGVSAGAILVASLALLADYAPVESRGKEIGMFDGVNLAGWGTGFVLGGILMDVFHNNISIVFYIAGTLGTIGFLYAYVNVTEPKVKQFTVKELSLKHITSVFKQRSVLLLTLPWLIIYILVGSIMTFTSKAGKEALDLPGWMIGLGLGGGCIAIVGTQRFFGKLSDKYGRVPLLVVGAIGLIGIMLTSGCVYYVTDGGPRMVELLKLLSPLLATFGIMAAAFAPAALASLADVSHTKRRGVTMSIYSLVISLGMIIGPITTGFLIESYGSSGIMTFLVIISAFMGILVGIRAYESKYLEEDE